MRPCDDMHLMGEAIDRVVKFYNIKPAKKKAKRNSKKIVS